MRFRIAFLTADQALCVFSRSLLLTVWSCAALSRRPCSLIIRSLICRFHFVYLSALPRRSSSLSCRVAPRFHRRHRSAHVCCPCDRCDVQPQCPLSAFACVPDCVSRERRSLAKRSRNPSHNLTIVSEIMKELSSGASHRFDANRYKSSELPAAGCCCCGRVLSANLLLRVECCCKNVRSCSLWCWWSACAHDVGMLNVDSGQLVLWTRKSVVGRQSEGHAIDALGLKV